MKLNQQDVNLLIELRQEGKRRVFVEYLQGTITLNALLESLDAVEQRENAFIKAAK